MQGKQIIKAEDRHANKRIVVSGSDISEDDISFQNQEGQQQFSYSELLDQNPFKLMKIEIIVKSERLENDLYIYETKTSPGIKIKEETIVISRERLVNQDVRVEAIPLKIGNKIAYFQQNCKF